MNEKRKPFDITTLMQEIPQLERDTKANDSLGPRPSPVSSQSGDDSRGNRESPVPGPMDNQQAIAEDPINPAHYRSHPSGIECIEVTRHMNFNVGNAIKYLWRYMDKGDPIENLKKAQWYIDDEIRRLTSR